MLSQKLQDDLMSAYQQVYEAKRGHAAGDSDVEKQASQLASDVKYKAKGKVKDGASDEEKKKVFMQILSASPAPNAVKSMARQKLLGEDVVSEMRFNDGKEGTKKRLKALEKKRGMKMPNHPQFKDDDVKEGKMPEGLKKYLDKKKGKKEVKEENINELKSRTMLDYIDKASDSASKELDKAEKTTSRKKEVKARLKMDKRERGIEMAKDKIMKRVKEDKEEVKEGSSYGITRGSGTPSGPMAAFGKAPRKQKGAMAYDGPNKPASEAKDRLLAKAAEKRKKMKKEEVELGEMMRNKLTGLPTLKPEPKKPKEKQITDVQRRQMKVEAMDPVGKEDGDINNDGKKDSTDSYLMKRRKAIGKAIAKKRGKVKEGFSAWRIDLDFNEQVKK